MVEHHEEIARVDPIADGEAHLGDDGVAVGGDLVLHLHRLDDHQHLAVGDGLTRLDVDGDDGAGQRADRAAALALGVVLDAVVQLCPDDKRAIFERMREVLRAKSDTQPLASPSAGCMFRNPEGASSGALIEQAGLKGVTEGHAQVSDRHANFIVNRGGAAAADVRRLVDRVRAEVASHSGAELEQCRACGEALGVFEASPDALGLSLFAVLAAPLRLAARVGSGAEPETGFRIF